MKYSGPIWILITILLAACDTGSQRRINREALQEEMRNREPKKLSEAEIISEASRQGREIADNAQQALIQTLQEAIQEAGVTSAIQYCNLKALPLVDSLSRQYEAEIRRTTLKPRNPRNAPDELEQQLLDAYHYNVEQGLSLEPNLQRVDKEYLLYTQPIIIGNELCLNCHGEPGEDITEETLQHLNKLYPQDKARNYKLGELRGMWSIKLPQKKVVNAL